MSLTTRELELSRLLARGLRNSEDGRPEASKIPGAVQLLQLRALTHRPSEQW